MGHVAVMSMYILMEGNRLLKVNSSLVAVTESIPFMPEPDREQPQQLGRSSNSEGFHVVRVFMFDLQQTAPTPWSASLRGIPGYMQFAPRHKGKLWSISIA